jgi:hypothetical protein
MKQRKILTWIRRKNVWSLGSGPSILEEHIVRPQEFYSKSVESFKLPQPDKRCSYCQSIAKDFPVGDKTVPMMKCINEKCNFVGVPEQFISLVKSVPLGSSDPNALKKPAEFTVMSQRRTNPEQRTARQFKRNEPEQIPKYPNGTRDTELEYLVKEQNALIVPVMDEMPDSEEVTYSDYTDSD